MAHHYMTERERYQLEALLAARVPVAAIAEQLGFTRQTIYNEIRRGTYMFTHKAWDYPRYSAMKGQVVHDERQTHKGGQLKIGSDLDYARFLEAAIIQDRLSPAAALAEARKAGFTTSICVTTLYSYIDKGIFLELGNRHLWEKSKRKPRSNQPVRRTVHGQLPSIDKRPDSINARVEPWHWEMDLVVSGSGGAGALLSMVERQSRTAVLRYIPDKRAATVRAELVKLRRQGLKFKSITTDNGPEFLEYTKLREAARCEIFYCHSYSAWEKGQVECQNKMLRRFWPKGTDFAKVPRAEIRRVERWMNDYPRKSLSWASASEVLRTSTTSPSTGASERLA